MIDDIYRINKENLEFNRNSNKRMNELLQPLKEFGITDITFTRTFLDGKRHYLCSNIDWVEHYLQNNFQDNLEHMEYYLAPSNIKYSLWNSYKNDDVFESLNTFGHGNGFSIYEHHESFVNQFDFTARNDNPMINNFYLKNLQLLEKFVENFKMLAQDLINLEIKDRFFIPKKKLKIRELKRPSFIPNESIDKFISAISKVQLSKQTPFPFTERRV